MAFLDRNKELEREKALRRAAEKRELDTTLEETFVDPYAGSNPSVNEELKERLSTKAKLNRLLGTVCTVMKLKNYFFVYVIVNILYVTPKQKIFETNHSLVFG